MRKTHLSRALVTAVLAAAFTLASVGMSSTAHAEPAVLAKEGDHSVTVLRIQGVLLALKRLEVGYNDGYYTGRTTTAVAGLQTEFGLPVTGAMDETTYQRMVALWSAQGRPAAANPVYAAEGSRGVVVQRFQNILVGIKKLAPGYNTGTYDAMTRNAVQALQRDEGLPVTGVMNLVTYKRFLVKWYAMGRPLPPAKSSKPTASASLDRRCLVGSKVICINKSGRKLYFVTNGTIQRTFDIRVGRDGYGTRDGVFSVFRKELKSWSKPYQVWMPYSMYFSGGQAVHYSYEFARYGYLQGSHGCVNMRDYNGIAWLYSQSPIGTKVVVYH